MTAASVQKKSSPQIPSWILFTQISAFAILYAIWGLPETILIRHICLITGALLGLYEVYCFRSVLLRWGGGATLPIWLLVGLFTWASFHLLFLSNNFSLQIEEYGSIWKRTTLGAIFALGLGLALANLAKTPNQISLRQQSYWAIFYLGLLAPSLIYVLKYILTNFGAQWGIHSPEYLKLHYGSLPFYVPKTTYVCFCLPTLAVALGQLRRNIANHVWFSLPNIVYALTVPLVLFVFYAENIKNGVLYSAFLILIFLLLLLMKDFQKHRMQKMMLVIMLTLASGLYLGEHLQKNESWKTLFMDAKVAFDTTKFDHWKFSGAHGYPNNAEGVMVSSTNYERLAWGKTGLILLAQNPFGYGLIERSYGHLAKREWPESNLHQSHSGWLDLALGIGIPGIVLILESLTLVMRRLQRQAEMEGMQCVQTTQSKTWLSVLWWILLASLLMWCTTEISQKVFFDTLIFWIALGAGLSADA